MSKPTRRTQPYRKGKSRPRGRALGAMKRGKPKYRPNPMDRKRRATKRFHRRKRMRAMRRY